MAKTKQELTPKEKLKLVEKELKSLHKKCIDAGYDSDKIRKVADPVLKAARRGVFKRTAKTCLAIALVAAVFTGMMYIDAFSWQVQVIYKKAMVKYVLPYYDWTWLYISDCAWENPFYDPPEEHLSEDECQPCSNITEFPVKYEVTEDDMTDQLYAGIPVVIGDDMKDWRTKEEKATLKTFLTMYRDDPKITSQTDEGHNKTAYFRTTRDIKEGVNNSYALAKWVLEDLENGKEPYFTAHWGNDHIDSFKALHEWYTKPYFLPRMCEPIRHKSYIMVGRRGEDKGKGLMLRPRYGELGIWMAQISGRNEIILQPIEDCREYCKRVRFVLNEGEILNVPSNLYQITYRPNSTEAVAIGIGYEFQ